MVYRPTSPRIEADVMARVAKLKSEGPGDVQVTRVSEITAVQTQRACEASLDDEDRAWLAGVLERVKSEAFGIQVSGLSRLSEQAQIYRPDIDPSDPLDKFARRVGAILFGPRRAISWVLLKLFPPKVVPRTGLPLPAPENLVLAARSWLLAELCAGAVEGDLEALKKPWEAASVER